MRGKQSPKRKLNPDSVFNSTDITYFINNVMMNGKKTIAQKIVYSSMDKFNENVNAKGLDAFYKAIDNVRPRVELRSRRVGGANYQVPYEVNEERGKIKATKWIIEAARKRKGADMITDLINELTDAFNNTGSAVKKREDTAKMAEANKAFSHFR